ncbi:hypothetical protein [Thauera humireducens]|uniref:hypothetical protein n=1 Tax=Thauera humireducens TaxID=1134435 RepID=UPI00311D4635
MPPSPPLALPALKALLPRPCTLIFVTMPFSLDNAIALLVLNALSMLDVAVAPLLAAVA